MRAEVEEKQISPLRGCAAPVEMTISWGDAGGDHGGDAGGEMYFCEEKRENYSVAAFLLTDGCET